MYEIMLNLIRTDARRKGANALDFPETVPESASPAPDAGEALDASIEAEAVRAAVRSLPLAMRSVVVLRYFEDMSVSEIAKALSLPEGTVKRRLHDARDAIRVKIARTIRS
jgi:RNA polymerase sigma-70 factor (ECF subfamily)